VLSCSLRECFWYDAGESGNLEATENVVGQNEVNRAELILVVLVLLQVLRDLLQLQTTTEGHRGQVDLNKCRISMMLVIDH